MKKHNVHTILILWVALLIAATAFAACAAKEKETPPPVGDGDESVDTVALFMPQLQDAAMQNLQAAIGGYATSAGIELSVFDAEGKSKKQVSQIKSVLADGVDAILLCPASPEELGDGVDAAGEAGIPVVVLRENIVGAEDTAAFVGPDFTDGGNRTMARAMSDLPDGGGIAEVFGAKGHPATDAISAGYAEALKGATDRYPIAAEGTGDWSAEKTLELVNEWFAAGKEPAAIVCNNDGMATGALEAVLSTGRAGRINIYGLGGQRNILDAIRAGTAKATAIIDVDAEAKTAVELAVKLIAGEDVKRNHLIPMTLITAENVDSYLPQGGSS
ncbi:MAG: sugar ABC transporter substrate-binding protein [Clostridiales Family XIII bacterium]|nr:sugar ABC transporter substrate-binding protein [Clostridiales Family XIII bacterium]